MSTGNWSLYTTQFSSLPQYAYYNPLIPSSVLESELNLLELIEQDGPFDGVLGYSAGAAFAAQVMIRHALIDPTGTPLFRFAVFINGGTPLKVFKLADENVTETNIVADELNREIKSIYLRPSNLRVRKADDSNENHRETAEAAIASRKREIDAVKMGQLADGRIFLHDGQLGVARYEGNTEGRLIDVPTLHVRCPGEEDPNLGLNILGVCLEDLTREYFHQFGHDFPRGQEEMRKISEAIREISELA